MFDGDADDFAVLFHVDGRGFAGGADDADTDRAFCDMPIDQPTQCRVIDAAVFLHRRDERHDAANKSVHGEVPGYSSILLSAKCVSGVGLDRVLLVHGGDALHIAITRKPVFIANDAQRCAGGQQLAGL